MAINTKMSFIKHFYDRFNNFFFVLNFEMTCFFSDIVGKVHAVIFKVWDREGGARVSQYAYREFQRKIGVNKLYVFSGIPLYESFFNDFNLWLLS